MARKSVIGPALVEKVGKQTHIIKIFVLFCFFSPFSPFAFSGPAKKKAGERQAQGAFGSKEDKAKKKKREETRIGHAT